jgi:hypothetical protein
MLNYSSIKNRIISSLKQNLIPGLILQSFAVLLLLIYFFMPVARPAFEWMSTQKTLHGYTYSFFSTALFGGLIPFIYLWLSGRIDKKQSVVTLFLFYVIFFGYKGIEVDFFYRLQAVWFGNNNDLTTLAIKVTVDQFVYSAFWAAPSTAIIFLWVNARWNWNECRQQMNKIFFCEELPAMIVSNWMVWLPAVSIVYSMPTQLQIPLFNVVLCFWVLMLSALTKKVNVE